MYRRIDHGTDCTKLQADFDQASENNQRAEAGSFQFDVTLSYMDAADARMRELGCY